MNIDLIKYSEKSYALFGEGTKDIKEELKALGCKFNKFLTNPETGEKQAGWIFSAKKLKEIEALLDEQFILKRKSAIRI